MPYSIAPPDYARSDEELHKPCRHAHDKPRALEVIAPSLRIVNIILALFITGTSIYLRFFLNTRKLGYQVVWSVTWAASWLSACHAVFYIVRQHRAQRPQTQPSRSRRLSASIDLCLALLHWAVFLVATYCTRAVANGDYSFDRNGNAARIMLGTWTSVFIAADAIIHTLLLLRQFHMPRVVFVRDERSQSSNAPAEDEARIESNITTSPTVQNVVGQRASESKQGSEVPKDHTAEDQKFGGNATRISIDTI